MASFGKLVVTNIVTTYQVRVAHKKDHTGELNLVAVALVGKGNYGESFPAVVNKGQSSLRYDPKLRLVDEADDFWFPLHRQIKISRTAVKEARESADVPVHAFDLMKATNAQFKTGSTVVAGGKTVNENRVMAYMCNRRQNHDTKLNLRIYNMCVQNIVTCTDLGYELNCEWMVSEADNNGLSVQWNPENFNGLNWVTNDDGVTVVFVVFKSGKVVATSMTKMEHIPIAEKRIQQLIAPFRAGSEPAGYVHVPRKRDHATTSKTRIPKRGTSKVSAALRQHRKLAQDVHALMKDMGLAEPGAPEIVLHKTGAFDEQFLANIPE